MKKIKYIFICLLFLNTSFLFGGIYEDITPDKFMELKNVLGVWQIVGYQYEWWISNAPKEKYIRKDMGTQAIISLTSDDCKEKLIIEYEKCNLSGKNNCDNAVTGRLQTGKLREINYLEIYCPLANSKRRSIFFGGMFYFNDGSYNAMFQTDGGYYILRKLTKQGIKSVGKIHKTSFTCDKETWTDVERLICTNKQLADADIELNKVYSKVLKKVPVEMAREIKNSQREWVKKQLNTVDIIWLEKLYADRIKYLKSLI